MKTLPVLLLVSVACADFPSFIKVCKRNEDISKCMIDNVPAVRSHLKKGIPKLLVPSLDPFRIPKVEIASPGFHINLNNLNIFDLDTFELKHLSIDLDKNYFNCKFFLPTAHLDGEHKLNGKLLFLQLNGAGHFNINLTNTDAEITMSGNRIQKDGKEYINFSDNKVSLGINQAKLFLDNLFPGEENNKLTENTNKVVNENIKDLLKELQPVIEETIGGLAIKMISKFFLKFSVDELFPK